MYKQYIKPAFDFTASLTALLLLLPLITVIVLLLYIFQDGSVFFTQERPGLKGRIFKMIKFRTMNDKVDAGGNLLPDLQRIHPLGNFLRKSSLDEIPQLFNVLIGDMSFVGPRPLLKEYLALYSREQARRHDVKPGITGWAQVNGRNAISWEKKFELDTWYVDNISASLDMKILFLTAKRIFSGTGVNADENTTMSKFTGK